MEDEKWRPCSVIANILWALSGLLLLGAWAVWDDTLADHLARTAICAMGPAVTITVKGMLARQARLVRQAFDAGREYEQTRELRTV